MKKKTIAVRTLESQLEYIEATIDDLKMRGHNLRVQIEALMVVKENLLMNIEAHMQEN